MHPCTENSPKTWVWNDGHLTPPANAHQSGGGLTVLASVPANVSNHLPANVLVATSAHFNSMTLINAMGCAFGLCVINRHLCCLFDVNKKKGSRRGSGHLKKKLSLPATFGKCKMTVCNLRQHHLCPSYYSAQWNLVYLTNIPQNRRASGAFSAHRSVFSNLNVSGRYKQTSRQVSPRLKISVDLRCSVVREERGKILHHNRTAFAQKG